MIGLISFLFPLFIEFDAFSVESFSEKKSIHIHYIDYIDFYYSDTKGDSHHTILKSHKEILEVVRDKNKSSSKDVWSDEKEFTSIKAFEEFLNNSEKHLLSVYISSSFKKDAKKIYDLVTEY